VRVTDTGVLACTEGMKCWSAHEAAGGVMAEAVHSLIQQWVHQLHLERLNSHKGNLKQPCVLPL